MREDQTVKNAGTFALSQSAPQLTCDETGAQTGDLTCRLPASEGQGHSPGPLVHSFLHRVTHRGAQKWFVFKYPHFSARDAVLP